MKSISKLFLLLFILIGITSCRIIQVPLENKPSENNSTYEISYLFEHEGIKVYRFYDMGHCVYFTSQGDMTAIKNDSTGTRTVTIQKEPMKIQKTN